MYPALLFLSVVIVYIPSHHKLARLCMKINIPLLALALGAFGIGVTEFSPMGMLPVIANDLAVSIPTAGMLISAYAFGVLIGAPLMTLVFANMSRRNLLLLSMGIFTLGNLMVALIVAIIAMNFFIIQCLWLILMNIVMRFIQVILY